MAFRPSQYCPYAKAKIKKDLWWASLDYSTCTDKRLDNLVWSVHFLKEMLKIIKRGQMIHCGTNHELLAEVKVKEFLLALEKLFKMSRSKEVSFHLALIRFIFQWYCTSFYMCKKLTDLLKNTKSLIIRSGNLWLAPIVKELVFIAITRAE